MNYIKIIINILLFPSLLFAQNNLVNDGVSLVVEAGTDLLIEDAGITNKNAGIINNAGKIYLEKDWTQTDISTYNGNGWLWFNGKTDQNLLGISTISNLKVDNGHKLILGSTIEVKSNLDLASNGNIELGTNDLVMSSGSNISNYNAINYIISNNTGYLQQEVGANTVIFPIGNASYNPATLSNTGVMDNFQIRVEDIVYDNGTSGNAETTNLVNATWHIAEQTIGGSNVALTTQWTVAQELTGFDRTNSAIMNWEGSQWTNLGNFGMAIASAGYWTQTQSGLTSFSSFAVKDATYSSVSTVGGNSFSDVKLFPNPSQDYVSLNFMGTVPQEVSIRVLAVDGKVLFQKTALTSNTVTLREVADFPIGTYMVHILFADGNHITKKFVKSNM